MQTLPDAHWLVEVHFVLQLEVPLQTYIPQLVVLELGQVPEPLHTAWLVWVPLLQLVLLQTVSAPGIVHAAWVPLQLPRQAPLPAQGPWPLCGAPETSVQVPGVEPLQYWQAPLQALPQQTPSTQNVLTHWDPVVQVCPCFSLHAPVPSQVLVVVLQLSGSSALLTATQVPPAPVQDWQVPHDAEPQHMPSTHAPLVHSPAPLHAVPFVFLATQEPPLQ